MPTLRLAELLVGLSSVSDLGMGLPPGDVIRSCVLATHLAADAGVPSVTVSDVYYTALLQHVGCTAYSHEAAALFRDELAVKRISLETDFNDPLDIVRTYLPGVARSGHPLEGLRGAANAAIHARATTDGYTAANCEVASMMARRVGLPDSIQTALLQIFEWWNGKGRPARRTGESIALASRVAQLSTIAVVFDRLGGPDAALTAVHRRAGSSLDPTLCAAFARTGPDMLAELGATDPYDAALAAEPHPYRMVDPGDLAGVLRAFGDAVDLKMPMMHGHASAVAGLARAAADRAGLDAASATTVHLAGFVHDLGRVAIPTSVWERPGPLGRTDWEQVRTHAYRSERILSGCPALAELALVAGLHHERMDGSGYHRGVTDAAIPVTARILAAADVYAAMTQDRPHRAALPEDRAAAELRAMVATGRLDRDSVTWVLTAAGHRGPAPRPVRPAGLTERQVEVVRLVAAGLSNREIARVLQVTPRTAEHHVQDIYAKIGVSSRAGAAMFAMEHRLLPGAWQAVDLSPGDREDW